ncbi:methylmalonyl-CoA epimerase [Granulicella aggregans]|uniref:Methylmalonyl-CoA epimerase n=1 Tax=Granulicella aggregans TaxID=474949 RepID=A0A7W7ZH59_9BACT|nr:methylmalonyl-CoA epimerase [Granulicella aggregans]MBB5059534.1 methylmalonyl-CoA epimerase [Granulicella aggregans]
MATSFQEALVPEDLPPGLLGGADLSLCLDHIGIAVLSIEVARKFYGVLGLQTGATEEIAHEGVRTAMLQLGSTRLELLEPLSPETIVGRFLERRGEGIHHIAIRVEDVDAKFDECRAAGMRLASDSIRIGAGGHRYFFIHPSSAAGVLVEIVADARGCA